MSDTVSGFPRIDLVRRDATEMSFTSVFDWNEEFDAALRDVPPALGGDRNDDEEDHLRFVSGTVYQRKGRKHVITAQASALDVRDTNKSAVVSVEYDASDIAQHWTVPRSFQRETTFWDIARQITTPLEWDCRVHFRFTEKAPEDLWFPLPSRVGGNEQEAALYEIRGVQGVRLADESGAAAEFGFNLRQAADGATILVLDFRAAVMLNRKLPTTVLGHGERLARNLVR